ncbi:hypothetical protein KFE25_012983 [Diacronema lutheri]|uniref:RING-CH-type domain-containing protein n=3 Tax=Diacronema lutheri TaxID=2081491 RepID=A0A8J5XEL0_DIALT|nr:hypothetical protein KFE25_012983 [Diacronema lutheri]
MAAREGANNDDVSISVRRAGSPPSIMIAPADATVGWLRARIRNDAGFGPAVPLAICHRGAVLADDAASLSRAGLDVHPSVVAVALPGRARSLYGSDAEPAAAHATPVPEQTPVARASSAGAPASSAGARGARGTIDGDEGAATAEDEGARGARGTIDGDEGAAAAEDERMCRICFDGGSSRFNRLLAPCRCSGSMRLVHARCLAEWRLRAVGTSSFTHCDQCRARYAVRTTSLAPHLRSRAVLHACTLLCTACTVLVFAMLPLPVERCFFRLVDWRPWDWLARRGWALRIVRGLLVVAHAGLAEHLHELLKRDQISRDACLRCVMLSCAANGFRILRLFAMIGVLHYLGYMYATARQHIKRLMLTHGEVVLDWTPAAQV